MAAAGAPIHGQGLALTFASSFFGEITRVTIDGMSRPAIDVTDSSDTVRQFIISKINDWGSVGVEGFFDKDVEPPMDDAAETLTITFDAESGELSAATIAGTAFMTDFSADIPLAEATAATFSCTIKWAGDITVTAAT